MNLIYVTVRSDQHADDDESLGAQVIAEDAVQAEELARAEYSGRGFTTFSGELVTDGFAGPARVLGHTGKGTFTWRA